MHKYKKTLDSLPDSMFELKSVPISTLRELCPNYVRGTGAHTKAIWYKIQCQRAGIGIEQKHITRLNSYAENPEENVERSHKTKYHIKPGTQLLKKFKGKEYLVNVVSENEFQYKEKLYRTLSAVALDICGAKVSGYDFFGFNNKTIKG